MLQGQRIATVKLWDVATGQISLPSRICLGSILWRFRPTGQPSLLRRGRARLNMWDTSGWTGARREGATEIDIPDV